MRWHDLVVPYREFLTLRFLAVLVLVPPFIALVIAVERASGWAWWLVGAVGWLAVSGLLYFRRLRAEADS